MLANNDWFDWVATISPNITVLVNGDEPIEGSTIERPYTVQYVANSGYIIQSVSGGEYYDVGSGGMVGGFEIAPDSKTASMNFNYSTGEFEPPKTFTADVVVGGDPEPPTFDFTVTQSFIDELRDKKATLYVNEVLAADGQQYNVPYDVRIEIDPTHYATEYRSWDYNPDEGAYFTLTPSNDFKTLTGTISKSNIDEFVIETELDESVVPDDKIPYNNIFVLTPEQTLEIATTQFLWFKYSGMNAPVESVPQGDSIISFIELPFVLPSELVQGSKTVQIGLATSNVVADYLNIDQYVYDMGTISVPKAHDNVLDFDNTVAVLHLPYTNPINIDVDYVIGCDLSVTYDVNFYNGVASVNITSSKIDGVIETKSIKLNIDIPFGKPDDNPSDNSPRNIDFGIDNGVLIPYVEILRNDAVLSDGFFTVPVPDESLLSNQVGFVEVDEVDLKVTASKDEKEMILRVLNSGVIIK